MKQTNTIGPKQTLALLGQMQVPKDSKTWHRLTEMSAANIRSADTTPAFLSPLAIASAIWPAPINPSRMLAATCNPIVPMPAEMKPLWNHKMNPPTHHQTMHHNRQNQNALSINKTTSQNPPPLSVCYKAHRNDPQNRKGNNNHY